MAWCFEDEASPETDEIQDWLAGEAQAYVLTLWHLEVANVLWACERRKRIRETDSIQFLKVLENGSAVEVLEYWSIGGLEYWRVGGLARAVIVFPGPSGQMTTLNARLSYRLQGKAGRLTYANQERSFCRR
jgi:hypothetical protein